MADCTILVTNIESDGTDETVSLRVIVEGHGVINAIIEAVVPIGASALTKNAAIKAAAIQGAMDASLSVGALDQKLLYGAAALL